MTTMGTFKASCRLECGASEPAAFLICRSAVVSWRPMRQAPAPPELQNPSMAGRSAVGRSRAITPAPPLAGATAHGASLSRSPLANVRPRK